jgi:hypothetical protein
VLITQVGVKIERRKKFFGLGEMNLIIVARASVILLNLINAVNMSKEQMMVSGHANIVTKEWVTFHHQIHVPAAADML